jgi:hypothetical protein
MPKYYGAYANVEERIQSVLTSLNLEKKTPPRLSALAREVVVPYHRLRARHNSVDSCSDRPPTNSLLNESQEAAIRLYIARCDKLGLLVLVP